MAQKFILVIVISALPFFTKAVEPVQTTVDVLKQEGRLVSVSLSLGEPLKIFVVGREEAQIDLSQMKLKIRKIKNGTSSDVGLQKHDGYYTLSEPLELPAELDVQTRLKTNTENFHFKINTNKP